MNGRRIGLALALVVCAVGGLNGSVATGGEKAKTKLKMRMECKFGTCEKVRRASTPAIFSGRVKSADSSCVDGRLIKIKRKGGPAPGPVTTTNADEDGKWSVIEEGALEGTYRAKTGKASGCKTGKSKKWTVSFDMAATRGVEKVRTEVTINDDCSFACRAERNYTATFYGKVKADKSACVADRKVILLQKGESGEGWLKIDSTNAKSNGEWEIIRADKPGFTDYKAKVKEVRKAMLRCLGATSDKEIHGPPRR